MERELLELRFGGQLAQDRNEVSEKLDRVHGIHLARNPNNLQSIFKVK